MKTLLALALVLGSMHVFGQEMDQRILLNKGEQGKKAFTYNKNSYNYMLFELDSSYVVVSKSSLSKEERKQIIKNESLFAINPEVVGTPNFNLFAHGIALSKTNRQYFELKNKQILVLKSIPEITSAFSSSNLNTK